MVTLLSTKSERTTKHRGGVCYAPPIIFATIKVMNTDANLQLLKKRLLMIIDDDDGENDIETVSGYIVGELLGDYDDKYEILIRSNPKVAAIAELASDLEISKSYNTQGAKERFDHMKQLVKSL